MTHFPLYNAEYTDHLQKSKLVQKPGPGTGNRVLLVEYFPSMKEILGLIHSTAQTRPRPVILVLWG